MGTTLLFITLKGGHTDIDKHVTEANTCVNEVCGMNNKTVLQAASKNLHKDSVKYLIEANPNVNAVDEFGATAMPAAVKHGHTDVVKCLLKLMQTSAQLTMKTKPQ